MGFNVTIETLKELEDREELYLEDILQVVSTDLFGEARKKQAVGKIQELPIKEEEKFIDSLIKLALDVRRIYDQNKEYLTDERKTKRWEKANDALESLIEKSDVLSEDLRRLEAKLAEINDVESKYKEELAKKDNLEKQLEYKKQLCKELEQKIEEAKIIGNTIEQLKQRIPDADHNLTKLKSEEQQLVAHYEAFSADINSILEKKNDDTLATLKTLQSNNEELMQSWNETKSRIINLGQEMKSNSQKKEMLQEELKECENKNRDSQKEIEELNNSIDRSKEEIKKKADLLENSRLDYMFKKDVLANQIRNLKEQEEKYQEVQNEYENAISEITGDKELEEWANNTDQNRAELKSKKEQLDSMLKEELKELSNLLRKYENN